MIRGREGEIHAIQRLSPLARARIGLIVDLPTKELTPTQSLDAYVASFVSEITSAWGTSHAIYLDMNRYGPEQLDRRQRHIVEHLFECSRQKRLKAVPVAGTDRGPGVAYNEAIARITARDGHGAALRLPYEDFSDPDILGVQISSVLGQLHLEPAAIDLILDAGSLDAMPPEEATEEHLLATVLQAIDQVKTHGFRNVIFAGSSVPESLPATPDGEPRDIVRTELHVWQELASRPQLPLVRFSDTGVWSPRQLDTRGGGGGPPPARVRIPLQDRQLFFRAESTRYRECVHEALRHPGVRNLPRCWGLDSLLGVARGTVGAETASSWVARDMNTHIELTARLVEENLHRLDRLRGIALNPVETQPWSQELLGLFD
jgi:hypothetical protein